MLWQRYSWVATLFTILAFIAAGALLQNAATTNAVDDLTVVADHSTNTTVPCITSPESDRTRVNNIAISGYVFAWIVGLGWLAYMFMASLMMYGLHEDDELHIHTRKWAYFYAVCALVATGLAWALFFEWRSLNYDSSNDACKHAFKEYEDKQFLPALILTTLGSAGILWWIFKHWPRAIAGAVGGAVNAATRTTSGVVEGLLYPTYATNQRYNDQVIYSPLLGNNRDIVYVTQ